MRVHAYMHTCCHVLCIDGADLHCVRVLFECRTYERCVVPNVQLLVAWCWVSLAWILTAQHRQERSPSLRHLLDCRVQQLTSRFRNPKSNHGGATVHKSCRSEQAGTFTRGRQRAMDLQPHSHQCWHCICYTPETHALCGVCANFIKI